VLSTNESKVLSVIGPYPAAESDISVFRRADGIMNRIPPNKKFIGDKGYAGEDSKISTPNTHDALEIKDYKKRARARHETFNKRLKDFAILRHVFRHGQCTQEEQSFKEHQVVFESICVLLQYDMKYKPLFHL
jgi:DDE superfamily endonuclease